MRKALLASLFLWLSFSASQAQDTLLLQQDTLTIQTQVQAKPDTTWRRSFAGGINLNQAAFSDNWKAGGISSIAFNTNVDTRADYKLGKASWDNAVQLQYGLLKNKGEERRKSIDRIFLDSKYGYAVSSDWNTFVSANFLTQFTRGYQYDVDADGNDRLISNFLSPGFLTTALGAEYRPNPHFSLRLSPFAPRFTFLADDAVAQNERYGVPEGKRVRTEWLAAMLQATYNRNILTNMNLRVNYMSYMNYKEFSGKRIDHMLNTVLSAKVNRYINVSLMANFIYDFDQDADVQYNQSLGLGILYTTQGFSVR